MITSLSYTVRFKTTGRVLAQSLTFDKGLTAITGPNEAGKSFVIEMIRYAFFGSAALRGIGDDYENLKVSMTFKDYVIDRTPKGGTITRGGEPLAVGTKALNAKVIEILGFGLDVFDMSCVCNQGEVERLGAMPASERKAMVDRVIGSQRIEVIQKWAGEQALLLTREVDVLTRGLREPVEPVQPEGYIPSAALERDVRDLRVMKQEYDTLTGWLSHRRAEPSAPPPRACSSSLDSLESELEQARDYAREMTRIRALPVIDFDVDVVDCHWQAFDLWTRRQRFIATYPRPTLTSDEVADGLLTLGRNADRALLRAEQDKLARGTKTCCPDCGSEFHLNHKAVSDVAAKLAALGDMETVEYTFAELQEQGRRLTTWASGLTAEWETLRDAIETSQPLISRADLARAKVGGHVSAAEKAAMLAAVEPPEWEEAEARALLDGLRQWTMLDETYRREMPVYRAWKCEYDIKLERQVSLAPNVAQLPEKEAARAAALAYEAAFMGFRLQRTQYTNLLAEIVAKQAEADGFKAGKAALADLRLRIKTYLVPSLSKVASHLLSQMTDGQRNSIIVDENFDIMVDGQRLETLSGSGKACANLALRIGLGQVLTNKVVSLFIGDEIDASMDAERAVSTHSSIRRLSSSVSQILLISHKLPVADTVVVLGTGANERQAD